MAQVDYSCCCGFFFLHVTILVSLQTFTYSMYVYLLHSQLFFILNWLTFGTGNLSAGSCFLWHKSINIHYFLTSSLLSGKEESQGLIAYFSSSDLEYNLDTTIETLVCLLSLDWNYIQTSSANKAKTWVFFFF